MKSLHAFARTHNIDCDLFSGDTVDIVYDDAQWQTSLKAVQAMRDAMPEDLEGVARYTIWSKEEAKEGFHVKGEECVGAVSYEAGSLSAYKFVVGVLKMCLQIGLELYTNTPAVKVENRDGMWAVRTEKGVVRAKKVVLATNGYTGFLCERFRKVIVPLRGQITAHRPGRNMPSEGLQTTYSFIYSNGYEYMIPRPKGSKFEGDIVIGGGLAKARNEGIEEFGTTDDTTINHEISTYLTETTRRYFGDAWGEDHADGRIRKEWTGIMGYSSDGFPFIGEVPGEKDLWIAASFQGHGMVLCFMCAKALAAMMSGDEKELESWFPDVFKVTEERMGKRFMGRLHTKPMNYNDF
jgi:glycine/D-amino acid oxidase-like deaminating enzyme